MSGLSKLADNRKNDRVKAFHRRLRLWFGVLAEFIPHPRKRIPMRRTSTLAGLALVATAALSTAPSLVAQAAPARSADAVPSSLTLVRTTTSLLGSHTWYQQTY